MDTTILGVSFLFDTEDLVDWIRENIENIGDLEVSSDGYRDDFVELDDTDIVHAVTESATARITIDEAFHQWLVDEIDEDVPGDIQYDLCAMERFIEPAPKWFSERDSDRDYKYLVTYKSRSQGMHDVEVRDERLKVERRDGYTAGAQNALHAVKDCIEDNSDSGGDQLAAIYDLLNVAEIKLADPNEPDNKGGV